MSTINRFEDLEIWNHARSLVKEIYLKMIEINDYGFKDQIQRAAVSVMNNIAEGYERNSDMDFRRFLIIAKASCGEVRSMLYLTVDLNYLSKDISEKLIKKCILLSSSIAVLIKYLEKSNKKKS